MTFSYYQWHGGCRYVRAKVQFLCCDVLYRLIVGYWIEILINEVITRLPSPDFAIRSRTLDKKARFVIGRKLLNSSGSNERFLIEGTIRPSLKTVGKTPYFSRW